MISLGVVDAGVTALFVIVAYITIKERLYGFFYMTVFVFLVLLVERLAPGALARLSTAIQSVNRLNEIAPYINVNPLMTFK